MRNKRLDSNRTSVKIVIIHVPDTEPEPDPSSGSAENLNGPGCSLLSRIDR